MDLQLPDGKILTLPEHATGADAAAAIGPWLARAALAVKVDGELRDLGRELPETNGGPPRLEIVTDRSGDDALWLIRHDAAHVLAEAVMELYPGVKISIGPPIEDGFYYDFDFPDGVALSDADFEAIEARMREHIAADEPFERQDVSVEEALERFRAENQDYKVKLIEDLVRDADPNDPLRTVSLYTNGPFTDLCRGPHAPSTGRVKAFRLQSVAGAYWRGDSSQPMLTRVYGTAFFSQKDLEDYLHRLEEAKRRDHRRLGKELELFTVNESVGAGLPLWLPKGATVRRLLEEYILERERATGYQHVYTPDLAKVELYERSGHWAHYKDSMFPPMELETEQMVLRPMNCPHHILIFESKQRSYRDLPVRIAELGGMYRYERSGALSGLSRVRCMTLNDAHIFCTPEQIKEEFSGVMKLVEQAYRDLGITQYRYRLSLRDKADKEKYVDNDEMWELGERMLREALDALGLPYTPAPGEAAFYGPKLDIQLADVMGHEETYSTIQVDFHLPNQFGLKYVGADGKEHRPVIIHRAILSTMERMVSYLIELYAGAFPVWLAPVQAAVLPITDRQIEYARSVRTRLEEAGIRATLDDRSEKVNLKIREAQLQKVPYMLVVGDREQQNGQVAVRNRKHGDQGAKPLDEFVAEIGKLIDSKAVSE